MSIYISPKANNYPGLDRGFNQRFKLDEALSEEKGEGVYLANSSDDIIDALTTINRFNPQSGEIRIISGGHCYENFTFQSKSGNNSMTRFVIDLSNMRGIYEETLGDKTYVVIEPGASNWLIQQTLHAKYGVAVPGGSCYSVCAGGHISGGGYGLLSRLHGLVVDYLAGVEMIIPDGDNGGFKIRKFDPLSGDQDRLDWASRGGGAGHFGITTKYYFEKTRVPAAPEHALFIAIPVPWNQFIGTNGQANFNRFMRAYYDACAQLPGQAFALGKFTFMSSPSDAMSIVLQVVYGASTGHNASTLGGVDITPLQTKEEALQVIDDFAAILNEWVSLPGTSAFTQQPFTLKGHPVSATLSLDTVYDLPWIDMTQLLSGSGENQNGKYKSSYIVDNFNAAETAAMYAFLTDTQADNKAPAAADKSQTLIQIDSYGGQINNMDNAIPAKTAVAARSSMLKTQYQTYWKTFEDVDATQAKQNETDIVTWFNAGYNSIHRAAQNDASGFPLWGEKYQGCYFNYPDRQIGVNNGHSKDPGEAYEGDFTELYFGVPVANALKEIKSNIDPENIFAFAQSVMNTNKK